MIPEGRPVGGDEQLGTILQQALKRPLLSASEELSLAERIERGDLAAKRTMIESNLRLVVAAARPYRGRGVPFADLVQEGTVGLVRAVERFDHRRRLRFSTYAMWWIRRSILDAVGGSQVIRLPPKAAQQLAAVRRAEAELERPVSPETIAERTGIAPATVSALRDTARVTASLDEPVGDAATSLGELLADERAVDPSEHAISREGRREIATMLRLLPSRHRDVLVRRYGLGDAPAQDHEQIGESLGVGKERSRQLEREAVHRLRSIAGARSYAA
jgi:RNA polymerase primary sigma factor